MLLIIMISLVYFCSKQEISFPYIQERRAFGVTNHSGRSRNKSNHFPFAVADRVIIKVHPFFSFFPCIFSFFLSYVFSSNGRLRELLTVGVKHESGK